MSHCRHSIARRESSQYYFMIQLDRHRDIQNMVDCSLAVLLTCYDFTDLTTLNPSDVSPEAQHVSLSACYFGLFTDSSMFKSHLNTRAQFLYPVYDQYGIKRDHCGLPYTLTGFRSNLFDSGPDLALVKHRFIAKRMRYHCRAFYGRRHCHRSQICCRKRLESATNGWQAWQLSSYRRAEHLPRLEEIQYFGA